MFTTPCIIRKNTPELRQKLEDLGYSNCIIEDGKYLFTTHGIFDCMYSDTGYEDLVCNGLVDCGDNEQLFLALAAMRDDTDKDQLFTNGIDWAINREAARNLGLPGFEYLTFPRDVDTPLHKATKEEILNCFQTPIA